VMKRFPRYLPEEVFGQPFNNPDLLLDKLRVDQGVAVKELFPGKGKQLPEGDDFSFQSLPDKAAGGGLFDQGMVDVENMNSHGYSVMNSR